MKVVLAGAFGNLGGDILKCLVAAGHEVVAADVLERDLGVSGYDFRKIDARDASTLKGLCDGADVVVTTIGLTKGSKTVTPYDIDYQGNLNLLNEAKAAGVKNFAYVSVIKADQAPKNVPMLDAKRKFEQELMKSGVNYVIFRPTGYFYDIIHVFRPMIEKGEVTLLGKKPIHANVISTEDFADFIVKHMTDDNKIYSIGGKETYSYEELAKLCFEAAGKEPVIKTAPPMLFDMLAFINKVKKTGNEGVLRFGKWTMTNEMVGDTVYGDMSFAQYIRDSFAKKEGDDA